MHILASELSVKAGDSETAWSHAQEALAAAGVCGDPAVLADATRICATPLRRQGRAGDAVLLLEGTLRRLDAESPRATPVVLTAAGSLALSAAYSAALAGQKATALELVERAQDAADRLVTPARRRSGELSSQQVQLYQVGVHHLLGQDRTAVRIARQIDPRALPTPERRARLATDTARALVALDAHDEAFTALLSIEAAAPEDAGRPSVRALTSELLTRRPALPGLRDFAVRTHAVSV
ncbi:transcriptional regulator [Actinacidiphila sp. ITFR-21]|uniref:transcriptional regulator n=1 Tax=Actinacidiphila sp. ITFR-21 TaxID=3075199 RepID=UPI002889B041|nr:transcriptional regulator [Streptomyces sp. ITFR-21]WNI20013.1 transcriptional regulator [Streptomyces sp. ITFR-21]